jgi:hypothetical protein
MYCLTFCNIWYISHGEGPMVSCEDDNELSGFIKAGNFLTS